MNYRRVNHKTFADHKRGNNWICSRCGVDGAWCPYFQGHVFYLAGRRLMLVGAISVWLSVPGRR